MKTLRKIPILAILLAFIFNSCCELFDNCPHNAVKPDKMSTSLNSRIVYYNPQMDWSTTEVQNIALKGGGSCIVAQFCQFELTNTHTMQIEGNNVKWLDGSFTMTGTEDNSITGVYEGYGTIENGNVSVDIVFYPQEGCGDFCNASGQLNGSFTNTTTSGVYELTLDGTISHDIHIGN